MQICHYLYCCILFFFLKLDISNGLQKERKRKKQVSTNSIHYSCQVITHQERKSFFLNSILAMVPTKSNINISLEKYVKFDYV